MANGLVGAGELSTDARETLVGIVGRVRASLAVGFGPSAAGLKEFRKRVGIGTAAATMSILAEVQSVK